MKKTSTQYYYFSAFSAFFIWGGWSYYVNSSEGMMTGLVSGITQGVASFFATLVVVLFVTKIYNTLPDSRWSLILPGVITVIAIGIILAIIHSIVGTPHIFSTISPSLTASLFFCIYTTYKLR